MTPSRRRWALIAVTGAIALSALLLSTTGLRERLAAAHREVASAESAALLSQHHQGEGPCLRWSAGPVPAQDVQSAAGAILAAGFGQRAGDVAALSYLWADAREAPRHELTRGQEERQHVFEQLSAVDRFWFWLLGRHHLDAIAQAADELNGVLLEEARQIEKRWSSDDLEKLRHLWLRFPAVLSGGGQRQLGEELRRLATQEDDPGSAKPEPVQQGRCADAPEPLVVLTRSEVRAAVSRASMGVTMAPVHEGTRVTGMRLLTLPDGGLWPRLGLCAGDVLLAVGGIPTTSDIAAREAYARLEQTASLKLDLLRRGERHRIALEIE